MPRVRADSLTWCRTKLSLALGCVLLSYSPLCMAQNSGESRFQFFAAGGSSSITDKSSQATATVGIADQVVEVDINTRTHVHPSGRLLAGFRYFLTRSDAFEVSYSYAPTNIKIILTDTLTTSAGSTTGVIIVPTSVRSHLYSFNYVRRFRAGGRWQPYLTAGIGGVHWQAVQNAQFLSGFGNGFAGNFGAGIMWNLSPHWGLQAEYRDFLLEHPRFEALAPTGMSHDQSPTVGVVYRF